MTPWPSQNVKNALKFSRTPSNLGSFFVLLMRMKRKIPKRKPQSKTIDSKRAVAKFMLFNKKAIVVKIMKVNE